MIVLGLSIKIDLQWKRTSLHPTRSHGCWPSLPMVCRDSNLITFLIMILTLLDGGGVRGAVELIVTDYIMETIKKKYNLAETPRPCECFDLIGGTSTGGCVR